MAAPSVKGRGGGSINNANRGGRNGSTGGNSSLGANSRWSSGPPRQLGSNTNSGNAASTPSAPSPAAAPSTTSASTTTPANNETNRSSTTSAFPSLGGAQAGENAQAKMHERMVFILSSLVGTMVTVTARGGIKYVGLLSAASTEQGELGASLSSAQQIISTSESAPELGPPKGAVIVLGRDLDEIEAFDVKFGDPANDARAAEKDSFRTDTDISKAQYDALGGGRVLQKWSDDPGLDVAEAAHAASLGINGTPNRNTGFGGLEDGHKSGGGGGGGAWDQFAVNERQFGVRSNYDEDIYTTKLDRSGKDFKERERNAERLAREILNSTTSNPHLAEERNHAAAEAAAGGDEEAKYGAVQRGPNAYVPPAARRAGGGGALPPSNKATPSTSPAAQPVPSKAAAVKPAPVSSAAPAAGSGNIKPPTVVLQSGSNDATPEIPTKKVAPADVSKEFSKFVSSEKERMYAKRKDLQKKEMQNELAALKVWHGNFQLKTPIPDDLDSPLRNKNAKANVSDKPRDPSLQKSLSPNATHAEAAKPGAIKALLQSTAESNSPRLPPFNRNMGSSSNPSGMHASKPAAPKMIIPKIPPFNPDRHKARQAEKAAGSAAASSSTTAIKDAPSTTSAPTVPKNAKADANTTAPKLSAKANAFKPFNPNATAFTPGAPAAKKTEATPTTAAAAPSTPQNPFFGSRVLKRPASHAPLHLREEFNPFKVSKVPEATSISPEWRFTGKPFRALFTAVPPATPATAPMAPFVEDQSFSMGPPQPNMPMQPGMVPMVPAGAHPGHGPPPAMQPHHPGPQVPHTGPPPHSGGPPQQMAMPFGAQPQFYPRFQQPQPFPHQMPMPGAQGMAYGAMPPQFVGQMPFSPPMPHGPHPVYSPQMANMPPPGQHPQFIPQQGPMPGPMPAGQPHGPGGGPGRGPHPPRSQGPQQMYFQQPGPGPVHAMAYGHQPHFMPGRPPGMPPMDGSFPAGQMADPNNSHMG